MTIHINLLITSNAMGFPLHPVSCMDVSQEGNLLTATTAALCLLCHCLWIFVVCRQSDSNRRRPLNRLPLRVSRPAGQPRGILARFQCRVGWWVDWLNTAALSEARTTLPESSSRPLPAKMAHARNLAHASLETAVIPERRENFEILNWIYQITISGQADKFKGERCIPPARVRLSLSPSRCRRPRHKWRRGDPRTIYFCLHCLLDDQGRKISIGL